ncbi:receptor-type tyrosine-protein phosphatase H [Odontesthes bonariensis]|uniref:receptor-type tyrosine-protein phosphatase H n=1 Tax=Odontesthes bonariensis TaxID=219752 RepID=UPI003F582560
MGKLLFPCAVSLFLAVVLVHTAKERQYFTMSEKLTWDEARNYCQICFKDLVTLTPQNIQIIIQKLNSDHWIGLRKNSNSTSNSTSMSWTRWADGDPLTFQNWYPGWPVFKSPLPQIECCSCSCTCPAKMTTAQTPRRFWDSTTENMTTNSYLENMTTNSYLENMTTNRYLENMTTYRYLNETTDSPLVTTPVMPVEAACERSPMKPPVVLGTNEKYIEDSCVAMLSFGPWVERSCLERLAFICYEDSFISQINVTELTLKSANVEWQRGPDGLSHYRIEVKGEGRDLKKNLTDLTFHLGNLTSGTLYSVQVFPVKCGRDLNPQKTTFYTVPDKVKDLKVIEVTETTVSLGWEKPNGNWDFYRVEYPDHQKDVKTEGIKVEHLTPGGCYTFSIVTGVQQKSNWSEASSIAACTKPGKVSNLTVFSSTNDSLHLIWKKPEGDFTGFIVMALNSSNTELFKGKVNKDEFEKLVPGLPSGSKINLFVTALANHTLEGDNVTIVGSTAPGPISNLTVQTRNDSLTATWNPPAGDNFQYRVELWLDQTLLKTENLTETKQTFHELTSGSEYTVVVFTFNGNLKSPGVSESKFTLPSPPNNLRASSETNSITLEWDHPLKVTKATYSVKISSSFWNLKSEEVVDKTSVKFDNLMSGSSYQFEVQTMAGGRNSTPAKYYNSTASVPMEISLSMMCSTADADACDPTNARTYVNEQLKEFFTNLLGKEVFWKL